MKDLPAVWKQVCPDKLTSSALVVAPCSVSVLAVAPQCPHSVSELVVGIHSAPILWVYMTAKNSSIPTFSPCCKYMVLSVGTNERDYFIAMCPSVVLVFCTATCGLTVMSSRLLAVKLYLAAASYLL